MNENYDTMTLTLEDNTELECGVLAIFPVADKQYVALVPLDDQGEELGEVYLYQFVEHSEEDIELINIDDDDEFEAVSDAFDELLDGEEFDELFEEDEQ